MTGDGNEAFCQCKPRYTGEDCADEILDNRHDLINSMEEMEIWKNNQDVPGMQDLLEAVRESDRNITRKLIDATDATEVARNKVTGEIQGATVTITEGLKIDLTRVSFIKEFGF